MLEERGGRTSGMAIVNYAWLRACVKAGLLDDPNYPDQQKWKPKKRMEIAH